MTPRPVIPAKAGNPPAPAALPDAPAPDSPALDAPPPAAPAPAPDLPGGDDGDDDELLPPVGADGMLTADDFLNDARARGQLQDPAADRMTQYDAGDDDDDFPVAPDLFDSPTDGGGGESGGGGDDFDSPLHGYAELRDTRPPAAAGRPRKKGGGRKPDRRATIAAPPRPAAANRRAPARPPAVPTPQLRQPQPAAPGRARAPAVNPMPPGMRQDLNRVGGRR